MSNWQTSRGCVSLVSLSTQTAGGLDKQHARSSWLPLVQHPPAYKSKSYSKLRNVRQLEQRVRSKGCGSLVSSSYLLSGPRVYTSELQAMQLLHMICVTRTTRLPRAIAMWPSSTFPSSPITTSSAFRFPNRELYDIARVTHTGAQDDPGVYNHQGPIQKTGPLK